MQHRETVKRIITAYVIIEKYGEKEILLDYPTSEIYEKEETIRPEKDEHMRNEKRFVTAGNKIRSLDLKRKGESE